MSRDLDELLRQLRTVQLGLITGVAEGTEDTFHGARKPTGHIVHLPGWAHVLADAITTIEELSEIEQLRRQNNKLKKERTTLRSRNAQLAREMHVLRHTTFGGGALG